jgi:Tetratricopeptide repeat
VLVDRRAAHEEGLVSPPDSTRDLATEDFLFHLYRGSELLQDNRILEAKEELEQALTMQPADAKGQDLLGAVYFRLGLYPRAIQIYEGLEATFPGDVSIKINLALGYLKTGQPEPARRVLRDVVQINPEHKRAWGYLGLALQKLGELEQAQIAFEKGGRPMMARKVTEFRRSLIPAAPDSSPPELAQGVRDMADTAFSELDTGELRFALAEPGPPAEGEGRWHTLELGGTSKSKPPPRSPFTKTLPPPWMGELEPPEEVGSLPLPSISFSAPPIPRIDSIAESPPRVAPGSGDTAPGEALPTLDAQPSRAEMRTVPPPAVPPPAVPPPAVPPSPQAREHAPPLLLPAGDVRVALHPSGVVLVRTEEGAAPGFAARLDAVRVVAGSAATRTLNRRIRDAETRDELGGPGRPFVRVAGDAQLVLGARPGHRLVLLTVHDDLAFVREDPLIGFELELQYENGRIRLESGSAQESDVVQFRGSGTFVLDLPGELASLPSRSGRPLIAQREWVVGWFGRLVTRALSSAESPGGHHGLIGFWGDGTVLVCVG